MVPALFVSGKVICTNLVLTVLWNYDERLLMNSASFVKGFERGYDIG